MVPTRILRRARPLGLLLTSVASLVVCRAYAQGDVASPDPPDEASARTGFGIWTYGKPLDKDREGAATYLDDEVLSLLGDAGVYFVYGLRQKDIGPELLERLGRCRAAGIEVHVSVTPMAKDVEFVNIWSFERLKDEIDEVLAFLGAAGLLGDPVTTLVYDMEPLVEKQFPLYGKNWGVIRQLRRYGAIQRQFVEFNRHVRQAHGLEVRICSSLIQAMDPWDGDNDLMCLFGLMGDAEASMSYMTYRRGDFGRDYIVDHCRLLDGGDTIILNAWKKKDHFCWGDLQCAIDDARLVLSCPDKTFGLEIWALWYFLKSYGVEGLRAFTQALSGDPSEWPTVNVCHEGLRSITWRLLLTGTSLLDSFAPMFRAGFSAY